MSTQPTPEWHNPDGLTDEQVETDKGWRLLLDSEVIDNHLDIRFRPELQVWRAGVWLGWGTFTGHILATTYRTRRPLPESAIEPKEGGDALWSQNAGTVVSATDPTKLAPSNAAAGTSNPFQYRRK